MLAMSFQPHLAREEFFELLLESWANLQTLWPIAESLAAMLEGLVEDERGLMMTSEEFAIWLDLPSTFTVYRGCYWHNQDGLAWCVDELDATKFPFMKQYRQEASPLIVRGEAGKLGCIVKLNGKRIDIIAMGVVRSPAEQLPPLTH